jgi:uncharacterized protein (TIGR03437 family)
MRLFRSTLVIFLFLGLAMAADAQSGAATNISLSFTGTASGNVEQGLSGSGSGTLSPFGAATVALSGGGGTSFSASFTFTLTDGDTLTASGPSSFSENSVSGTVAITGGSGALANATGSFSFVGTAPDGTGSANYPFTLTGSGTIQTNSGSLSVSPTAVAFRAISGGNSAPAQTVSIVGSGTTAVKFAVSVDAGTAGSAAPSWIGVAPLAGSTPGSLTVTANPGTMGAGTYAAAIHITASGNSGQAPITVSVSLTITTASPQLHVSPAALELTARVPTPSVQTPVVVLSNSGGGTLSYSAAIVGQSSWITSVTPATGAAGPNVTVPLQVTINSQGLAVGNFHDILRITSNGGQTDVPISLFVAGEGAILSVGLSGATFEARQGNGNGQTLAISVLDLGDPSSTVNFTAKAISGSDWAIVTNPSGSATPSAPGSFSLSVGGDANSLPVGGAYALIQVTAPNALNSPQYVVAVLYIEPATNPAKPNPLPAGLFATTSTAPQTVTVFTSSTTPDSFQASASTEDGGNWLTVNPASGTVSTQNPAPLSISTTASGLANGIYTGNVNVSENGFVRTVDVTFLVTGQSAGGKAAEVPHAVGCTPSRVILTQTALSNNFAVPAGWPASLIVLLNDDCGNAVSNGSVVASFSNGDPPVALPGGNTSNVYSTTWQPSTAIQSMTVTINASSGALQPSMQQLVGGVEQNTLAAPALFPGGTLGIFFSGATANQLGNGLAPGNVAQVFGAGMAPAAGSPGVVPLANQFSGTFMVIGAIQVPLYYVSAGQLDIQVPFELTPNQQYTAVVAANGAITLPVTLNIVPVQPGMAAYADGSVIAQHAKDYSLVTAAHPAAPGEPLIIYLAGMGATNPAVASGDPTPLQLVPAAVQPTIFVDGQSATIAYAGLTPGGIGLYQINFTVPSNAASGNLSLVVKQGGTSSNTTTLPVSK